MGIPGRITTGFHNKEEIGMFQMRPYAVHITPAKRGVRRYVCRRETEEQAIHVADKLLKGAPGALVEVFRGGYGEPELVACIAGRAS